MEHLAISAESAQQRGPRIRPIETRYKGFRFRSRLEARWAVYFDALGLLWEYEREGYDLEGVWYLPDFWLPQVRMWAEVKPDEFDQEARRKVDLLVQGTGFSCILLIGSPDCRAYDYVGLFDDGDGAQLYVIDCVLSMYHEYPTTESRFYCNTGGCDARDFTERNAMFDDVPHAVEVSRSARFDRGKR